METQKITTSKVQKTLCKQFIQEKEKKEETSNRATLCVENKWEIKLIQWNVASSELCIDIILCSGGPSQQAFVGR